MKTFLNEGKLSREDNGKASDYTFPNPASFFSLPSNLITNLSGVSGGRILLGSKASLQALSLVNREAPLVQGIAQEGEESFVKKYGKDLLSISAENYGVVKTVTADEIVIKDADNDLHTYPLYSHFNLGRKSFISNIPKVAVGDVVKKGQLLAVSNYTDNDGNLALGVNLKTAVMPLRGGNFEDAICVSESGAKKLICEQIIKFRTDNKFGAESDKAKYVGLFPNKYVNSQLAQMDIDGAIKKGSTVVSGDPIILSFMPKTLKSQDMQLGKLSKVLKNSFTDSTIEWDYEFPGEVVDVSKTNNLITVYIKTQRGLATGDKLSQGFGAKGVVTIIPDSQMPTDQEGKPVDVCLNSMSVTSRVAPGLLVALGMGKLAQKLGKPVLVPHFSDHSAIEKIIADLKKEGISDTETLYDPSTGKNMEVLVGPLFFNRLTHISEDKQSSRSQGSGYSWSGQPTKTNAEESSKRVGNLGTTALLSHNAKAVLEDIGTIKSVKNDEYWRRLKLGLPALQPDVPFVFKKFLSYLRGAGINVKKTGDTFNILPMTNQDITNMSKGPISDAGMFKSKGDKVIPEAGGLFDPINIGIAGDTWNHINLSHPIPNPISEDYFRKMLGVTKQVYEDKITTGEIVKEIENIDIDSKIKEYEDYLRTGKKSKKNDALKVLCFLRTLKNNKIKPVDLVLNKIPVIPAQFRPYMVQGDLSLTSDVNNLYKDLILNTKSLKNSDNVPEEIVNKQKLDQYHAVKAIYGLGEPITVKNKEKQIRGLLSTALGTHGGSAKTTMFQSQVVNKPVDLVGRAVLAPDSSLGLDEAYIPQDILWKTYAPFIIRRLVQRGVPSVNAAEYVKTRNSLAGEALHEELQHRPGIISRDPSLHKYNLTGFFLKPNPNPKDKTLKMNPLCWKSFNADADGDQLNLNIPAGDAARREVIEKMLPSRNLLFSKNFSPLYVPSNEAALGMYQSSTENKHNTPKKYKSEKDVITAFNHGDLEVGDNVEVD